LRTGNFPLSSTKARTLFIFGAEKNRGKAETPGSGKTGQINALLLAA
jgi:hypothetical protein